MSINVFENATSNDNARHAGAGFVLAGPGRSNGSVPRYFLYMANDPKYTKIVLDREVATVHEGEVSRLNKGRLCHTSLVNNGASRCSTAPRCCVVSGMTSEQLFEVTTVVSIFVKNASFTTALQLDPTSA